MRFDSLLGLLLCTFVSSGCDPDPNVDFFQDVSRDPSFPGNPGDPAAFQDILAYTPNPDCAPNVLRKLDRKTEVRIFRGRGITNDDAVRFAGGLTRYYDYYGVSMFTRHDPIDVPLDHAIALNEAAIMDWMRNVAGVDPNCMLSSYPSLSCERAFGAGMFYNVKQFLNTYAEPAQDVINIVLLKRVAALDPSPDAADLNWGIAGLGLSQELLNSAGGSELGTSLEDVLDESDFSPTVFIAVNLTDFVLREPDIVIAHEFGHAYGLEHLDPDTFGSNLMNPSAVRCDLPLNASQLNAIEEQTARYGNRLSGDDTNPLHMLSFTHRATEVIDILRSRVARLAAATRGGMP